MARSRSVDAFELELGTSSAAGARIAERDELLALLAACGWDTEAAARRLGVHRATIYRRMERLEIVRPSRPPDKLLRPTRRYLVRQTAARLA